MENLTPSQLLPDFYRQYNLPPDGGQSDSFVKVEITEKINVYIPNFDARRKAVLKHDVHHLVTGYPSILKGEAEISAWEIASGCTNYWAALLLDSQGLLIGLFLYPAATFKAFKKGRRSSNLYQENLSESDFLNMEISTLKRHLKWSEDDENLKTSFSDVLSFVYWILICSIIGIFSLALIPFLILYNLKLAFNL